MSNNMDNVTRTLIMDSLVARSGKTLSPELIQEICFELVDRLCEPKATSEDDEINAAMKKIADKYGIAINNLKER